MRRLRIPWRGVRRACPFAAAADFILQAAEQEEKIAA